MLARPATSAASVVGWIGFGACRWYPAASARIASSERAYAVMDDLTVIDLAKKRYVASVPNKEGTCYGVNVSSDGKKIYIGGGGSTVTIYDARTLKRIKVLQMASDGMDLRRIAF